MYFFGKVNGEKKVYKHLCSKPAVGAATHFAYSAHQTAAVVGFGIPTAAKKFCTSSIN
jgi:hypothetical protein